MNDIYQSITDKIIAELEAGTVPWIRPWAGGDDPFPRNALSQRPYRGINTIVLGLEALCRGYATHQWLTFRQALQLGGHIRKGERSSTIIYYELRQVEKADSEALAEGDDRREALPAAAQGLPRLQSGPGRWLAQRIPGGAGHGTRLGTFRDR
jgi:antirestriction protein ArdC